MAGELRIRSYTPADFPGLIALQRACFPPPFPAEQLWQTAQLQAHVEIFPAGALCAELDGQIVGSSTSLIIQFDPDHPQHAWAEVADDGFIRTHNPAGDTLYGIDMAVHPDVRRRGVARAMYLARYRLVGELNLKRFMAAGRMPGYHRHAGMLTPETYGAKVVAGELTDPVITPQLRAGLAAITVLRNYIADAESHDCAMLLAWPNPAYQEG